MPDSKIESMKQNNYNGTIDFHPNGRGTWIGKTWNGEELTIFRHIFFSRGAAERFAIGRNYRFVFVTV